MWGKTNDLGLKPATAEPGTAYPPTERMATAAQPARVTAFIGKTTRLRGEIYSQEELYLDGDVEGSLEVRNLLTIGPNGKVKANVKAKESQRISIEDGAYFKGGIDILRPETAKKLEATPKPVQEVVAPPAARAAAQ
jgi:cytoskeletal protein CcmA (bactofilin family)